MFFQAPLPESVQAEVQSDNLAKKAGKGVVVMKDLFTSLKGFQVLIQVIALVVNIAVFSNSIARVPGKENNFYCYKPWFLWVLATIVSNR